MNRRSVLALLGSGATVGLAGCAAFDDEGDVDREELTIDPADEDGALSAADFRAAVADARGTHGDAGVWGRSGTEPGHELAFQGAWSASLHHGDGVTSEHLLALYRLPPGPEGAAASQAWLWSGVDPADAGRVRRIETRVSLPEGAGSLGIYSPGQTYRAADTAAYRVESGRLDAATLGTAMPLASGRVRVGVDTRMGDGGVFVPAWVGDSGDPRSLAATTELRWADDATLDWTVAVETTR